VGKAGALGQKLRNNDRCDYRSGLNEGMNHCPLVTDPVKVISASLLRLRMKSPFFGTLAMFVRFLPSSTISTAATDGRDIFFNPDFLQSLPINQQDGLLLHELLHAALLHPSRVGTREPKLWNIAADIVVNGTILRERGFELPPGALRDRTLEHLSVEEVYELLQQGVNHFQLIELDLLPSDGVADEAQTGLNAHPWGRNRADEVKSHWRQALQQAAVIAAASQSGRMSGGFDRELTAAMGAQLDWRSYLWRYLVQTPTDFQGFDRRFVGRGLYLETLAGESVRVYVAVDTSRSVGIAAFQLLMDEVKGILGAYPHIECHLYYADTELDGPYILGANSALIMPQGGGGTSFVPFFDRVQESWDGQTPALCIYLTDGYGEFPDPAPLLTTLWVVTPGGLDLTEFPFGEAVRLLECAGIGSVLDL
jgi:predicted metal-dependent peptidase